MQINGSEVSPEIGPGRVCAALADMAGALGGRVGAPPGQDAPLLDNDIGAVAREAIDGQQAEFMSERGKSRWCEVAG